MHPARSSRSSEVLAGHLARRLARTRAGRCATRRGGPSVPVPAAVAGGFRTVGGGPRLRPGAPAARIAGPPARSDAAASQLPSTPPAEAYRPATARVTAVGGT